ncbi:hypothetical protein FBUS_03579 [Fasciolopsis buskii]|uniref:Uncharacterized protein n=1 Tax=Fasciolopsis buskii TaxID=27845 RepID=A0A8E0VK56_9TREM|nr:hypothetical protein FBUS_03579 [Fasciolopsis buski]
MPSIGHLPTFIDTTVAKYGSNCPGYMDVFWRTDPANEDGIQPAYFKGITTVDLNPKYIVHYGRPKLSRFNYRATLGTDDICSYPSSLLPIISSGVIRDSSCQYMSKMQAYKCGTGLNHRILLIDSLDADRIIRRIAPFAFATDGLEIPSSQIRVLAVVSNESTGTRRCRAIAAGINVSLEISELPVAMIEPVSTTEPAIDTPKELQPSSMETVYVALINSVQKNTLSAG